MDEQTIYEQQVYDHYKKVEAENFHLKKQLSNKNKEIKRLKHLVRVWKGKAEDKPKKQHYRNGRKRGRNGRNG
jgi:uncharacterized protein (DUF305 family)